jgi:hypothetical protein
MHWGLPCSKEKLKSVKLHEVVPQGPLQQFGLVFLLGRAQNYKSNKTSFMIFRALYREIWIFKV